MHNDCLSDRWRWLTYALLIATCCWLCQTRAHQSAQWRGAYFSMAANLSLSGRFLIDTAEVSRFDALPAAQQATYRFRRSPPNRLTEYVFMQTGYGYVCALARQFWPFGGDSQAIILWQVTVHIGLCLWLLTLLSVGWQRWAFVLGYACNPLVVRYVTFDFYYFWQVIPSFLLVTTWLGGRGPTVRDGWRAGLWLGPLLGLLFVMRPAMLGSLLALVILWAWRRQYSLLLVVIPIALGVIALTYHPAQSSPWRPMYVGVAAYQNLHMNTLSDRALYELYETRTGQPYRHGGTDLAQDSLLTAVLTQELAGLWQKAPLLFLKHACINTLLAFSAGYVVGGGDWLNYALALLGLAVLAWLLRGRQYGCVLAVLATVGTFTPYYPPIPAYLYGAYLLLFMGVLTATLPEKWNVSPV